MTVRQLTPAIIDLLSGLPRAEAVKALSAALAHVVADLKPDELPGDIARIRMPVPAKRIIIDRYQPVWDYLKTVEEYTSLKVLREHLVSRFGERGTPSKSHLHRYIKANSSPRRG